MKTSHYPPGWDEERVCRVLEHYETQSDKEAVAEDEAVFESPTHNPRSLFYPIGWAPTGNKETGENC